MLLLPGSALAQDPPAEFAPPAPAPVVDTTSAGAFAKLLRRAQLRSPHRDRRERVRVLDVESTCLQAPFLETRYGCVFTLRAAIISRRVAGTGAMTAITRLGSPVAAVTIVVVVTVTATVASVSASSAASVPFALTPARRRPPRFRPSSAGDFSVTTKKSLLRSPTS